MKRDLDQIKNTEFDLIVIGGGIFGATAAWDAVLRGLKVLLIDKSDFCHATSSQHFKMIHGGMRYIQHLDFKRVRESSNERSTFFRIAPHLTSPVPYMIPTYGHGLKGKEILKIGLWLYDLVTFDRNKNIKDPKRRIPNSRSVSKNEILQHFPELEKKNLTGGIIFYDGHMYNPVRVVISFIRSAVERGLIAINYLEAIDYLMEDNRIDGVLVKDFFSGEEIKVRSKMVLNSAGPWAQLLNQKFLNKDLGIRPTFSRDLLMVVSRPLTNKYVFGLLSKTHDTDALLDRGGRHIFVIPWRGVSLIGVWHKVHNNSPDKIIVNKEELQEFIDDINKDYPGFQVTLDDITMINTGLILFGNESSQGGKDDHSFAKRSILIDHKKEDNINNLITQIGVRATVARIDSIKTIDMVFNKLGKKRVKSKTGSTTIYGGDFQNFDLLFQHAHTKYGHILNKDIILSLIRNYGSRFQDVLKYADEDHQLFDCVGKTNTIKAELIFAVKDEIAQTLSDVIMRRTDMGTAAVPSDEGLHICAKIIAELLNWNKERIDLEVEKVKNIFSLSSPYKNYDPIRDLVN